MSAALMEHYALLKALHLIAMVAWMAGMLYLPRLFVYHCGVKPKSEASEMLKTMERRLLRVIMNPAMIATFVFGILLIIATGLGGPGTGKWIHAKIVLVLLMAGVHGILSRRRKDFEKDANTKSAKYFRILNEVPTALMIVIILLAVLKPF